MYFKLTFRNERVALFRDVNDVLAADLGKELRFGRASLRLGVDPIIVQNRNTRNTLSKPCY